MKKCSLCKKEKVLDFFYKHPHTKTRRASRCKECEKISKNLLSTNRRKELVRLLGGKCSTCGYKKCEAALDFHHKNAADKKFEIADVRRGVSFDRLKAEAMKCILLCANCHREFHFKAHWVRFLAVPPLRFRR